MFQDFILRERAKEINFFEIFIKKFLINKSLIIFLQKSTFWNFFFLKFNYAAVIQT
jgi:hypothetical protein